MKKIQTKSGFVCEVNERTPVDWDYINILRNAEKATDAFERIDITMTAVETLLGKDQTAALAEHIKDKNGIKDVQMVFAEFREIMSLIGEETKKS